MGHCSLASCPLQSLVELCEMGFLSSTIRLSSPPQVVNESRHSVHGHMKEPTDVRS